MTFKKSERDYESWHYDKDGALILANSFAIEPRYAIKSCEIASQILPVPGSDSVVVPLIKDHILADSKRRTIDFCLVDGASLDIQG